jgi:hypothetical protein
MYTSVVLKQTVAKKELELWLPSPTDLPMCSVHVVELYVAAQPFGQNCRLMLAAADRAGSGSPPTPTPVLWLGCGKAARWRWPRRRDATIHAPHLHVPAVWRGGKLGWLCAINDGEGTCSITSSYISIYGACACLEWFTPRGKISVLPELNPYAYPTLVSTGPTDALGL